MLVVKNAEDRIEAVQYKLPLVREALELAPRPGSAPTPDIAKRTKSIFQAFQSGDVVAEDLHKFIFANFVQSDDDNESETQPADLYAADPYSSPSSAFNLLSEGVASNRSAPYSRKGHG